MNKTLAEKSQKLQHMAFYDELTGLPNRYMLNEHLHNALVQCRDKKQQLAVLFLDLDKFKSINDALGHGVGDLLLQQVSERLVSIIKNGGFAARHGGDEFIIVLENTNKEHVVKIINLILFRFIAPFVLNKKKYFITPSIGISMYPNDAENEETLIKYADRAMYAAKEHPSKNYSFYTFAREEAVNRRLQLQNDLRLASRNKELQVYYQPKVNLKTGEMIGVEALLRWKHPTFGFVSPMEFIPLAEESGLMIPIGKWVLKKACEQNRKWYDAGFPSISMAVNVSIQQFHDEQFIENVKEILLETELNPELLELEITESIMQNIKKELPIIKELKKLGVRISVDDFGTGYSSLSVLSQLPIDYLKIDQSFVKEALSNPSIRAVTKTIIQLGHNLKFDLIAEGVETEEQAHFLLSHGCQIGQGYLFSKPLPPNEIEKQLKIGCHPFR
ncbi:putative bifunctional diguanylate cyclase/phosphodiesterase [Domibacillus robiginosus]|uniref:putative bifunctional diguanylate cyclase/phosphodiesterase n=1 Tax=Domibacillus robiginosus TaxID=1071054 RepID=UPI00155A08EF|nr:EAL domain-containing protein [Domibacillus robiginosus]